MQKAHSCSAFTTHANEYQSLEVIQEDMRSIRNEVHDLAKLFVNLNSKFKTPVLKRSGINCYNLRANPRPTARYGHNPVLLPNLDISYLAEPNSCQTTPGQQMMNTSQRQTSNNTLEERCESFVKVIVELVS